MPWFALPHAKDSDTTDKGLAKIVEGASPRRHAETSPVKVKDTHTSWIISCLRQRLCVEIGAAPGSPLTLAQISYSSMVRGRCGLCCN